MLLLIRHMVAAALATMAPLPSGPEQQLLHDRRVGAPEREIRRKVRGPSKLARRMRRRVALGQMGAH